MVAWAPLIGAGLNFVGSLFGGSKKQTTTNEVDYVKLRRNAEKAGFNPLTALRNGGSAGFAVTTHPALSFGERFGNAVSSFGGFLMNYDRNAEERADQEGKLLDAQLGLIQAETERARSYSFNVPQAQAPTRIKAEPGTVGNPFQTHILAQDPRYPNSEPFWMVNPDGPDNDQQFVPETSKGVEWYRRNAVDPVVDNISNGGWSVRKLTPEEQAARENTWHRGWLPSFSFK